MTQSTSGTLVGHYELLALLGAGSFSSVFEARDVRTGEQLAVKQLTRAGPIALSRFKREFRTVQGLHHPNLIDLRELFEADDAWFIAMELLEGVDLMTHLRQGRAGAFALSELHHCFAQLTDGLMALHERGVIHRDVKPHNVLVTQSRRAVLLDFGLIQVLSHGAVAEAPAIGTVAYMAPEQVLGGTMGPAADFYALGICMYEALAGRSPFAGLSPGDIIDLKPRWMPPSPAQHNPAVPAKLATLCMRLLEIDPERRPGAAELLRSLRPRGSVVSAPPLQMGGDEFLGRSGELERLGQGLARSCAGDFVLMLIEGESGVGKSALAAEFLARVRRSHSDAMILESRCYENELLAYKAFDGAIDQLARKLAGLPAEASAGLLLEHAALLPRLFPALLAVPAFANAPRRGEPAEPTAQRLAALHALTRLLSMLSRGQRLVLHIDDLHWADGESFKLLHMLGNASDFPQALVIATVRPTQELAPELAREVVRLRNAPWAELIALPGLSRADAGSLAIRLLGPDTTPELIDVLAQESGGHPLLLRELAQFSASPSRQEAARPSLHTALAARIETLGSAATELVVAVAIAGKPYPAQVFAQALELPPSALQALAGQLLAARLLRRRGSADLACYHDQVRLAALRLLPPERARPLHAALAEALARQPLHDLAEVARQHEAAGHDAAAIAAYARAAEEALEALAFARTVQLCTRALALHQRGVAGVDASTLASLHVSHGHALARSGRQREAAEQYLAAAQQLQGEQQLRLRILSSERLLHSEQPQAGVAATRELLRELDIPMATSTAGALARIVWNRARLRLRGLAPPASPRSLDSRQQLQLEALWRLAYPIQWTSPHGGTALITEHMRLAAQLGERTHLVRAMTEEAFAYCMPDPHDRRALPLLSRARELLIAGDDPALEVTIALQEGWIALMRWDLLRSRERLEHALTLCTEQCADTTALLGRVRVALGSAWHLLGNHARLASEAASWLLEAGERGERFGVSVLEGVGAAYVRHLMADDPTAARTALSAAMAPWPAEPFQYAHWGELLAVVGSELYRGGEGAQQWLQREQPRLGRALLVRMPYGKAHWRLLQAQACLAAGAVASSKHAVAAQLQRATQLSAQIEHESLRADALALRAQLAALGGERERALQLTRDARDLSDGMNYWLLARPLEYLEGLLEAGEEGSHKRRMALACFEKEGWQNARRAVARQCPAIDLLERMG